MAPRLLPHPPASVPAEHHHLWAPAAPPPPSAASQPLPAPCPQLVPSAVLGLGAARIRPLPTATPCGSPAAEARRGVLTGAVNCQAP